jgi:DNA/RNA endonuclease YhcR with UshA esterase domain
VVKKENLEAVNGGFDGDVASAVKGKTVIITGTISLYREKPQIDIAKPEQIKIQADEAPKE